MKIPRRKVAEMKCPACDGTRSAAFRTPFGSDICVPSNKRKRTGQCQGEHRKQRAEWCGPWSNGRSEPAQKAKPYNSSDEKRGGVIDKSIENEVGNLA